jgi:two-component system sensor histidine kinase DesK
VYIPTAAAFAGVFRPVRRAVWRLALLCASTALVGLLGSIASPWWQFEIFLILMIGTANVHFMRVRDMNLELQRRKEENENLARVAERERIARDLHDVLGHTLSLIVLKAELASKLAERDPARAAREVRDVEGVARKALAEVRETVRGYRPTLADEVARGRSLLEAAGIRADVAADGVSLDAARDETLAFVLREAVTNTVRHSGAAACRIRVRQSPRDAILTVEDDGRGGAAREGNGLRGMRERLEAFGGTLSVDGRRGLRLTATIPVAGETAAEPPEPTAVRREVG